jgi:hypothetical protein
VRDAEDEEDDEEGFEVEADEEEDGEAGALEDAWLDFSSSRLLLCCEIAAAPWALAIACVRPETPGAVGPEVEPGWVPAADWFGDGLPATRADALDPLLLEECPWSSRSQAAASRATATRPIW